MKATFHRASHEFIRVIQIDFDGAKPPENSISHVCPETIRKRIEETPDAEKLWGSDDPEIIWQQALGRFLSNKGYQELQMLEPGEETSLVIDTLRENQAETVWNEVLMGGAYHRRWWEHLDKAPLMGNDPNLPQHWISGSCAVTHTILANNPNKIYEGDKPGNTFNEWARRNMKNITAWMLERSTEEDFQNFSERVRKEYPKGLPYNDGIWQPNKMSQAEAFQLHTSGGLWRLMQKNKETTADWLDWLAGPGEVIADEKKSAKTKILALLSRLSYSIQIPSGWWDPFLLKRLLAGEQDKLNPYQLNAGEQEKNPNPYPELLRYELIEELEMEKGVFTQQELQNLLRHMRACKTLPTGSAIILRHAEKTNLDNHLVNILMFRSREGETLVKSIREDLKRNPGHNWSTLLEKLHEDLFKQKNQENALEGARVLAQATARLLAPEIAAIFAAYYI